MCVPSMYYFYCYRCTLLFIMRLIACILFLASEISCETKYVTDGCVALNQIEDWMLNYFGISRDGQDNAPCLKRAGDDDFLVSTISIIQYKHV